MTETEILAWLADYWPLVAGPLALLGGGSLWWRARGRRDDAPPPVADAAPRAPLTPNRPDIAPAARVDFAPAPVVAAPVVSDDRPAIAPAIGPAQQLRAIKGIGPKLGTLLTGLGITRYDQIAGWSDADIAEVDRFLGSFSGRIVQDRWVEQARLLAVGDRDAYVATFGAIQHEPGDLP